jgi:hypothetical protein
VKQVIVALFAGSLVFSSLPALAADANQLDTAPAQGETKTEKAKDYVKKKAHNTKVRSKRATRKARRAVANRKTTDPASPNESAPAASK